MKYLTLILLFFISTTPKKSIFTNYEIIYQSIQGKLIETYKLTIYENYTSFEQIESNSNKILDSLLHSNVSNGEEQNQLGFNFKNKSISQISKDKNLIKPLYYLLNNNHFIKFMPKKNVDSLIILSDTPHKIKWIILDETKNIINLFCQKAITHFRGRDYTVWFCSNIPIQIGPWKLKGLPGIILEAKSNDGYIHYIAQSIKNVENDTHSNFNVDLLKNYEIKSYKKYYKNKLNQDSLKITHSLKQFQSNLPRGIEVTSYKNEKMPNQYNIELTIEE